jgi:hypothetical protein
MKRSPASAAFFVAAIIGLCVSTASADTPKELKVKSGTSVAVVNLVDPKPDCSASPGPVALPSLREKPANGTIQLQILITEVGATGNCPARKIPAISMIYTPNKDFVGTDSVQIDIEVGNRTTSLSYRLVVLPAAQSL